MDLNCGDWLCRSGQSCRSSSLLDVPSSERSTAAIIERDRYFEKPFDGQQLLAAIRTALGSTRPKGEA